MNRNFHPNLGFEQGLLASDYLKCGQETKILSGYKYKEEIN